MTTEHENQEPVPQKQLAVSDFGYDLIRNFLLGELLGQDAPEILYWGGKTIARRFPCANTEELIAFFAKASWGNLELVKQSKDELIYRISGEFAARRFDSEANPFFTLESGFLAEQTAMLQKTNAEAFCQLQKRSKQVEVTVKWE